MNNFGYTVDILRRRYKTHKECCLDLHDIKQLTNLPIKTPILPRDITENTVKYIIRKYDNDPTCSWGSRGIYSELYDGRSQPELYAFESEIMSPPFCPKQYFGVMYILDMRKWLIHDIIVLWKVNVTNETPEWKQIKINNTTTYEEAHVNGKRPYISWKKIYEQLPDKCVKVYEGPFEGIF